MTTIYSEAVESAFRTIELAPSAIRAQVFEQQAVYALIYGADAGFEKIDIVDRLETIATGFGWPPDERQRLITAAFKKVEKTTEPISPETKLSSVDDSLPLAEDQAFVTETGADSEPVLDEDIPRLPEHSDEALALLFAETNPDLRYVAALGKWFVWTGVTWRMDETLAARDRVRRTLRAVAASCAENKKKEAKSIGSAKTESAVERLAPADRKIAAVVEQFDRGELLLNTPAGVIDLQSGQMAPHDRHLYLTKVTGVAPDFAMPTPVWDAFLGRIMDGHDDLIEYLRRVSGYSLTGSVREHALFFFHGAGANGKSTFVNAIIAAAGDYHRTAAIETFTSSSFDRHPTDLAGLRGARLVTSIETEEGRRWAESRIKSLTGGDKIAARYMRQDYFEYTPQFKLIIAGNHRPGLRSVDEAIRRRFNLVPFSVTIPASERDETLADKLRAELPGILAWMIKGCGDWLQRGLAPPKIVTDATSAYLESEDAIAAWLDELAERDANSFTKTADLFASWSAWAEKAGEYVGSSKRFAQALEVRGFVPHRHRQLGRGFTGIRLTDRSIGAELEPIGPQ